MTNPGYVKIYRILLESRVFQNEGLLKVWIWCMLKASYRERWISLQSGKSIIETQISPGQFIYGRYSAAKELKMPPSTLRNRMTKLKNMGNLDIKEDKHFSVITIMNWSNYQETENIKDSKKDHGRTMGGPWEDTNKKVKKVEKEYLHSQFDKLYQLYPRKQGKQAALKAWLKNPELSNGLFDTVISALQKQKETIWKDKERQFIPHPASWLNGKRWEDEIPQSSTINEHKPLSSEDIRRLKEE